jgi:PAS domain S-box-containing protein
MITFGDRLRELRKAKGSTQGDLANRVGIDFTYLSKLENGVMPPPGEKTISALASVLNADPDELFGLAGKIPSQLLERITPQTLRVIRSYIEPRKPHTDKQAALYKDDAKLEISDTKCTQGESAEYQERYRSLVENSVDGILIMNSDLETIYESPNAAIILGYNPGELAGKDALSMIHADDVSTIARQLTELASNPDETGVAEARVKHRDGTWRIVEAVGKNLLHDPNVNGIVIDFRDITERRLEEQTRGQRIASSVAAKRFDLTKSEQEVLALILEGMSNRQVAERLLISPSTVKFHVGNILNKLGVTNRTEAAVIALQCRSTV